MNDLFIWVLMTGALLIVVGAYLIHRITQEELDELGILLDQKETNV